MIGREYGGDAAFDEAASLVVDDGTAVDVGLGG
jgi:hypothetical protein